MPAGLAPVPSDAPVGQQKKGTDSQNTVIPFERASKWHIEQSNTQSGVSLTAAQQQLTFPLASYGYLSAIFLTVQLSGGAGGVALTFFEDAPWSLLAQVQLNDVNGVPLFQLSGFNAYLAAKYGAYRLWPPDTVVRGATYDANTAQALLGGGPASASTSGPNGAYYSAPSATTGNTKFILPIFLEFGQGGLGCLPNMDASARYQLLVTVAGGAFTASATGPYVATATTIPTTLPTMAVTVEVLCRSQPPSSDMYGNLNSIAPPAVGTAQYWTAQSQAVNSGANTMQLTRVGNLIRNHIIIWRNSNGTRNTAETSDMPSLFEFDWDVGQRYVANIATFRLWQAYESYGLDAPNGTLLLPNTLDPDKVALSEYGHEWLGTVGASKLTLRYTAGAGGGTCQVLTNDIVPASTQVYAAPTMVNG